MTPDTIQFQCGYCSTTLTVPAHMAGVSGPCPNCGQTITSPAPAAPQPEPAAAPAWPPVSPLSGTPAPESSPAWQQQPHIPGGFPPSAESLGQGGLPPRRAPGQQPLSNGPPGTVAAPAGTAPSWGAPPPVSAPPGGGGLPNHSRLIPGAPVLPTAQAMGGFPGQAPLPGSLLGRDVPPAPVSPLTQPLQPASPPLHLGGHQAPAPYPQQASPASSSGRQMPALREPRGASFIRLAIAALFLLGFLGIVGYFVKDYLPASMLSFLHREEVDDEAPPVLTVPQPLPTPPVVAPAKSSTPQLADTGKTPPAASNFDPAEPAQASPAPMPPPVVSSTPPPATAPRSSSVEATPPPTALIKPPAVASVPPVPSPPPSANQADVDDGATPEEARPAVEALKKFLGATTLEERLRYTLGADLIQPLMERYYSRASEGPVTVDAIRFIRLDPNPELGSGRHCIFSLENKTWEYPVPVMLEEQKDGFKVDWVAFVEFKDRILEKFFQTYQEGPMRFHVGIMRHHYFDDGVPNADQKDSFRISPAPPNTFQGYAFLDKESPLAQDLKTRLPWENHVWAIVDLEWKKLGSQQWVELKSVPQMHWYSLPTTQPKGTTASAAAQPLRTKPGSGKDMPPGISKNGVGSANMNSSNLPPPGISKNGVGSGTPSNNPPPGVRKSSPDLPGTIKRPLPAGR